MVMGSLAAETLPVKTTSIVIWPARAASTSGVNSAFSAGSHSSVSAISTSGAGLGLLVRLYSDPTRLNDTPFSHLFCAVSVRPLAQLEQLAADPTQLRQLSEHWSHVGTVACRLRNRPAASHGLQVRSVTLKASTAVHVEQLEGDSVQVPHSGAHRRHRATTGSERSTKSPAVEQATQLEEVMLRAWVDLQEVQLEARREQVKQEVEQAWHLPVAGFRKEPDVHCWQLYVAESYPNPARHEPHLEAVPEHVAQGLVHVEHAGGASELSKN